MSLKSLYMRTAKYLTRHGVKASLRRAGREAHNYMFHNRDILYCRDLHKGDIKAQFMQEDCRVERYIKRSEVPERLLERIGEYYSKDLLLDYVRNRYEKGACLWCQRNNEEDFGYIWTLVGRAMTPHYYFPMMDRDVYLFDALVFPPFRGRGVNSALLNYILRYYQSEGFQRAYLETKEWNTPVINLMVKNEFVRIGLAKMRIQRRICKVKWWY